MILRATLRSFVQRPGFFIVAVTTLGLGIAGATSIFSVIESVLLRPLPYADPDRLVMVWGTESDDAESNVSGANLIDWQDRSVTFDGLAAFTPVLLSRLDGPRPERISGVEVTPNFFDVLGVHAHIGRTFSSDEEDALAAILSYGYWERAFGSDPGVTGRSMMLNDRRYTGHWRGTA